MNKKQIINVIEIEKDTIKDCTSFIVKDKKLFNKIMLRAERLFVKLAKANGMENDEKIEAVHHGNFNNAAKEYYVCIAVSTDKV